MYYLNEVNVIYVYVAMYACMIKAAFGVFHWVYSVVYTTHEFKIVFSFESLAF